MLRLADLWVRRGAGAVLHGVSLEVPRGQLTALVGANGAGKTTLLLTVSGILRPHRGELWWIPEGEAPVRLDRLSPRRIVELGIIHCPEGRQLFASMTVYDNLLLGAHRRRDRRAVERDVARMFALFPILGERRRQRAGSLSGGEQTMLAIARALMARPRLLLLDEPSLGLAPQMADRIFETLLALRAQGVTLLLVEQNAQAALEIADRGYVLEGGRVVRAGPAHELRSDPMVQRAYLGIGA